MSMAELMQKVATLPLQQQNELAAFLLHLQLQHDTEWKSEMARRIDDKNPANWVSLENWKKELANDQEK